MTLVTRYPVNADQGQLIALGSHAEEVTSAATLELVPQPVLKHAVKYTELAAALTLNATSVVGKLEFDELRMFFENDGTERIVTFGTNFISSGTLTIPISKSAIVTAVFIDGAYRIQSREIEA